jgi:O-methyltransferase
MRWRESINRGLIRTTGYRLERPRPAAPPPPTKKKRPKRAIPRYVDPEAREVLRSVRARTMTSHEKLFALVVAARHVVDHDIDGAVVECGVWRGGSMQAIARTLLQRGVGDRDLHLFDTFEGMPEPTAEDRRYDGEPAGTLLAEKPRTSWVWAIATLEDVQAGMAETGYPAERIHYHRGMVEDTIPAAAPEPIALLRLDTDWYASTRHELEHLYDRVPPGGLILFDDYGYWEGARRAIDEFVAERKLQLLLVPMGSGRLAVKP